MLVNTGGHEHDEGNIGKKQKDVWKECPVRMHNQACLQWSNPYSLRLRVNVSKRIRFMGHVAVDKITLETPVECRRQVSTEASVCA